MTTTSHTLSDEFRQTISELLNKDAEAFFDALDQPRIRAIRVNSAKITHNDLSDLLGVHLSPVPWCDSGFIVDDDTRLGGHVAHLAGLFYIQEPSSMAPVAAADVQPGQVVIDVAAAPGGKSTQLASKVGSEGAVVANEVVRSRLRPLHDNFDVWGTMNAVTMSRSVRDVAQVGPIFDTAILDAPCSGEGLFRRDPTSVHHWSPRAVHGCARRQENLIGDAANLVKVGGVLVYSTCTFSRAENENVVANFLATHPGWELDNYATQANLPAGVPNVGGYPTERTARLWPHIVRGEGQFVARLVRTNGSDQAPALVESRPSRHRRREPTDSAQVLQAWAAFADGHLTTSCADERLAVRGDTVYARPVGALPWNDDDLVRVGTPLGKVKPGRFEPDPALATALTRHDVSDSVSWQVDSNELAAYCRGETITDSGPNGWVLVCVEDWGLGWAKRTSGQLKNHLPKHLRAQSSHWARRPTTSRSS